MSDTVHTNQTPSTAGANDGQPLELGMKFQADTAGQITAIRHWKDASETPGNVGHTPVHVGNIWDALGNLLASVTFTGESASGWQEQALASPLSILANTTYVVSVNADYFSLTGAGLQSAITNGHLSSVADGSNGVFGTTIGGFPTSSFNNSDYFRDVVFSAGLPSVPGTPHSTPYIVSPLGQRGYQIGGSAATFSSSNAPAALGIKRWIEQRIDGVLGYVPWFSSAEPGLGRGWSAFGEFGIQKGVSSPTFTTNNAPEDIAPRAWIPVDIDGIDGWVPWFGTQAPSGTRGLWSAFGDLGARVGVATATMSASNAPAAIAPRAWITVAINGVTGFVPWFST